MNESFEADVTILASKDIRIEGEAERQLKQTAALPGMFKAVGFPELHPGKGSPVGAVFAAEGILYPYLVGNDVGCGMGLWRTDLKRRKIKRDRWVERLIGLEGSWEEDVSPWLDEEGVAPGPFDIALGTIGGGNHFAELQVVERVDDKSTFEALDLSADDLMLLVHSGSRGLGEALLRSHVERHKAEGLFDGSDEAAHYLAAHDHALAWARANRALIAHRFLTALGAEGQRILDRCHNSIAPGTVTAASVIAQEALLRRSCWLHRKGAVPATEGVTILAGSRGSLSYLVLPIGDPESSLYSLGHGAGRKWKRSDSKERLRPRFKADTLTHTELGGRVICEDRDLLYEEAPQAYKDIDGIVRCLRDLGRIKVVASLRPVITYKTRSAR